MPGYSQLKKLSEQILKLGNEINVRAERGEKAEPYPVPDTVPEIDDSEDFVTGMPEKPKTPEQIAAEEAEAAEEAARKAAEERAASGEDDIFGSDGFDAMPDLSAFEGGSKKKGSSGAMSFLEEEEEKEEEREKGIDGSGYAGFGFDDEGNLEDTSGVPGPDIASLMGGPGKAGGANSTGSAELDELLNAAEEGSGEKDASQDSGEAGPQKEGSQEKSDADLGLPDFDDSPDFSAFEGSSDESEEKKDDFFKSEMLDLGGEGFESDDFQENPQKNEKTAVSESGAESSDFSLDAEISDFGNDALDMDAELGGPDAAEAGASETEENASGASSEPSAFAPDSPAKEEPSKTAAPADDGLDLSDLGIDGLEIEEYTPQSSDASTSASSVEVDVDSIFGASEDEKQESFLIGGPAPENKKAPPKQPYKPKSIEEDIAILKPDIFTQNPVTAQNPPYYVTSEYGKLPKTAEEEAEEAAAKAAAQAAQAEEESFEPAKEPAGFGDMDFDSYEEGESSAPAPSDEPKIDDGFAPAAEPPSFADSIDMGEGFSEGEAASEAAKGEAPSSDQGFENADLSDQGGFDMDAFSMDDAPFEGGEVSLDMDTSGGMPDFGDLGDTTDFSSAPEGQSLADFSVPDTDSQLDAAKSDFELEGGDFAIPGFSEDGADPYAQKQQKGPKVSSAAAPQGEKIRSSLTPEEYKKFKKNLSEYPLNVRIAVEDMIVKNEFTDEVYFELIDKILKKVTARQLAGYLEKMLDVSIQVPRDFEKRTAAEYEAYKASFGYQLKAKILPAVILGTLALMILFCVCYLGHRLVVQPLWAEKIYREGYVLLEHEDYEQSEMKFNDALTHKPKKKWFFRYAQGYRQKRQYERAEKFYRRILLQFGHDKQAGLEYADMKASDLGEYERAVEILRREVLDYHVNDAEGVLALGDTYLDWATEEDSSKFQDAFEQYSLYSQLYGDQNSKSSDLIQARFLRYYIRTNQLRNVLQLKEYFYPREKALGAEDWTELSGYLMDKLYGELPREEESLRGKIEDLRAMMIFAVNADPKNPVANYNLSRYLVEVGDHDRALNALKETERLFDESASVKSRDVHKQLDNYRLLGEEYVYSREYILARETFTKGINLFEKKRTFGKFEGDENMGKMFSDMGDLEYFISGELDAARKNYQDAIENKWDNQSIRYRVGYIDYSKNKYAEALANFLKASEKGEADSHILLAIGNTLSLKNDNYAAQSYYDRLLSHLDFIREKYDIEIPQIDESAGDMVETYMKAANNLGVSQFRVSRQNGESSLNAKALVNFQNSIRYHDALTRNPDTLVRLPGSNLAEQNLKYATNSISAFEPEIYTDIPRTLTGEKGLSQ